MTMPFTVDPTVKVGVELALAAIPIWLHFPMGLPCPLSVIEHCITAPDRLLVTNVLICAEDKRKLEPAVKGATPNWAHWPIGIRPVLSSTAVQCVITPLCCSTMATPFTDDPMVKPGVIPPFSANPISLHPPMGLPCPLSVIEHCTTAPKRVLVTKAPVSAEANSNFDPGAKKPVPN